MKPIADLNKSDMEKIKVICFDCDGVTVKRGTKIQEKGGEMTLKVNTPEPQFVEKLLKLKDSYHIAFNSGRSIMYLIKMYAPLLWDNVSFISENGLFILSQGQLSQNYQLSSYELSVIKNIRASLLELQLKNPHVLGLEPKVFITSLHCKQAIPEVEKIVFEADYRHEFYCWWNGEAYDINPKRINKGTGLIKLAQHLNLTPENFITVGNGINDHNMTNIAGLSITTDPDSLQADFYTVGEHLGGEIVVDRILEIT